MALTPAQIAAQDQRRAEVRDRILDERRINMEGKVQAEAEGDTAKAESYTARIRECDRKLRAL